jgi:hypothetical protein
MGVGMPGEASATATAAGASRDVAASEEDDANDEEEESLVHHAASVGDVEVTFCFVLHYASGYMCLWFVLDDIKDLGTAFGLSAYCCGVFSD